MVKLVKVKLVKLDSGLEKCSLYINKFIYSVGFCHPKNEFDTLTLTPMTPNGKNSSNKTCKKFVERNFAVVSLQRQTKPKREPKPKFPTPT